MCEKNLFEKFSKNMSTNTKKAYKDSIRRYEKFHQMPIGELIQEALNEQKQGIPEQDLKIYDRIIDFKEYLIENYKFNSVKMHLTRIKTYYKRNRVTLPYLPPIDVKQCKQSPYIEHWEILSKEEIRKALPHFSDNFQARIMLMATGGYSLEETRTLTIKQYLNDLYPYHKSDDPTEAMKILAKQDDIIWVTKLMRVKTQKPYYGVCNPETTQKIAESWMYKEFDVEDALFSQTKHHVTYQMGVVNDRLDLGKAGDRRRFTPHSLRRFNATNLAGSELTGAKLDVRVIDELQGRSMNSTQERYIKTNPIRQKMLYASVMNNVSLFNQYSYEVVGNDVHVYRVNKRFEDKKLQYENEMLRKELENIKEGDESLLNYINVVGKDNFKSQLSKLLNEL